MTTTSLEPSLESRLAHIADQVERLVAEADEQRRRRQRWEELTHDLAPVATSALDATSTRLESLDVSIEDATAFASTVAESLPALTTVLARLEPLLELTEELSRLSEPAMSGLTDRLAELDRRGYPGFLRSGIGVVDQIVTSYDEADVRALGDNVVLILDTVKEMTQPEVMGMLRRTIHLARDSEDTEPPSTLSLLRQLRDPHVRRGLSRVLSMLRSIGEEQERK